MVEKGKTSHEDVGESTISKKLTNLEDNIGGSTDAEELTLSTGPNTPDQEVKDEIIRDPDIKKLYDAVIISLLPKSESSWQVTESYKDAMDTLINELMPPKTPSGFTNFKNNAKGRYKLRQEIFKMDMSVTVGTETYTPQKALARYVCQPLVEYFTNMNAAIDKNPGLRDKLRTLTSKRLAEPPQMSLEAYNDEVTKLNTQHFEDFSPYLEANPLTSERRGARSLQDAIKGMGKEKFSVSDRISQFLRHERHLLGNFDTTLSQYIPDITLQETIKKLMSAYVADANIYGRKGKSVKERRREQMLSAMKLAGLEGYYDSNLSSDMIPSIDTIQSLIKTIGQ